MAGLILPAIAPVAEPRLHFLVAGFVTLALGVAILTYRRMAVPLQSIQGTRRSLLAILVYSLCSLCFWRVLSPGLLGQDHSPWLLALGDVIFVTLGLFVWVIALSESRPWRDYGFHMDGSARVALTLALGAAAAFLLTQNAWGVIGSGKVRLTPDSFVFAFLFASVGSALPEELLFRGYLQGSLHGQVNRWAKLMFPAVAFAIFRAARYLPGAEIEFDAWLKYMLGVCLPLGMWWGLMRDLAGGSLWPSLVSHFVVEFGNALAGASPHA